MIQRQSDIHDRHEQQTDNQGEMCRVETKVINKEVANTDCMKSGVNELIITFNNVAT